MEQPILLMCTDFHIDQPIYLEFAYNIFPMDSLSLLFT